MTDALFQSDIKSLPLLHRGKVRDIYAVGADHMLIVTTDRLSALKPQRKPLGVQNKYNRD